MDWKWLMLVWGIGTTMAFGSNLREGLKPTSAFIQAFIFWYYIIPFNIGYKIGYNITEKEEE